MDCERKGKCNSGCGGDEDRIKAETNKHTGEGRRGEDVARGSERRDERRGAKADERLTHSMK